MDAELRNLHQNLGPGYLSNCYCPMVWPQPHEKFCNFNSEMGQINEINLNKVRTIHRLSFRLWFIGSFRRLIVLLLTVLHILRF